MGKFMKVAYMGVPGSFTEEAAVKFFSCDTERIGCPGFEDVIDCLKTGQAEVAVLPIENSSTGSVNAVVDLLREEQLYIDAEIVLKIEHNLLGLRGVTIEGIHKVVSHPQGLEQCSRFIKKYGWQTEAAINTAVAAKELVKSQDRETGVIASARAADLYGLDMIASSVNDNKNNYTRFVRLGTTQKIMDDADKISVVFVLNNKPGSLYAAIRGFAENGINLIKIESRPIWTEAWHYFFHMDFEGTLEDMQVKRALRTLSDHCTSYRLLGQYKKCDKAM